MLRCSGRITPAILAIVSILGADALAIQARHSAEFMKTSACKKGRIGAEYSRTMAV